MKNYSVDADFKSRHRQHNTRRQIQCQHPNLLLLNIPKNNLNFKPIETEEIPTGYGSGFGFGYGKNTRKSLARRATNCMKGAKSLNKKKHYIIDRFGFKHLHY